ATSLERGGVDGILVENLGDAPYYKDPSFPEMVASFTKALIKIKQAVNLPLGVNVLRNGARAALAMAYVTDCKFIRVNVLIDAYLTDQGIIEGNSAELLRYKKSLGPNNIAIFADIRVKHAVPLAVRSVSDSASDALERGGADALIVTGKRTGLPPSAEEIRELKASGPTLIGSGLNEDNLDALLPLADGAIVGTHFKEGNYINSSVSQDRVMRFMKRVEKLRIKYGTS
ncbi:MAG: BtpA/SgcQ family protein, partial [Conexivisphaerales archaeon]